MKNWRGTFQGNLVIMNTIEDDGLTFREFTKKYKTVCRKLKFRVKIISFETVVSENE